MTLSRICTCDVCDAKELTDKAVLPIGWVMTWEFSYTLCDLCISKFEAQFGEKPLFYLEGGEKELTLFDLGEA